MAREGLNFTQFYSASPACTASRYGLLTGRNPRRSGFGWVIGPSDARYLHPDEATLAEGLKARGYATGIFGKWHLGNPNAANGHTPDALPLAHGFDAWLGTNVSHDYNDARLIRSNPAGRSPVSGYEVLRQNIGTIGNEPLITDLTQLYRDAAVAFIRKNRDQPFFAYIAPNYPHLHVATTAPFEGVSERGLFGDCMAEIDDLVATVRFDPASTLDLLPTAFALAGQPLPADRALDGRDIRPHLNPALFPGSVPEFQLIYVGWDQNPIYAVRKGPWKLHTHLYLQTGNSWGFAANSTGRVTLPDPLLFNLENDPSERDDVAARNPSVVADLQAVINTFNACHAAEGTFWN